MGAGCCPYWLALLCPWLAVCLYREKCDGKVGICILLEVFTLYIGGVIYAFVQLSKDLDPPGGPVAPVAPVAAAPQVVVVNA